MEANIISIAAGKTKTYGENNNKFESAYKKDIFFNFCEVDELGIIEDFQVDKRYHGGIDNAIHMGSIKHFENFQKKYNKQMDKLSMGCNIFIDSLDENDINIGDIFSIWEIKVEVSQPRQPCWKIGAIYDKDISRFINNNSATGWYLRVLNGGVLDINDKMVLKKRVSDFSIKELNQYLLTPPKDDKTLQQILNTPSLANAYKKDIQRVIKKANCVTK